MVAMVASWRRAEMAPGGWRCLILTLQLVLASINCLEPQPRASGEIGDTIQLHQQHQQQTPTSAANANPDTQGLDTTISQQASCDLLMSANNNIGSYCQCKNAEYPDLNSLNYNGDGQDTSSSSSNPVGGHNSNNLLQISQLNCYPQSFTQIIEDLTQYLALNFSSQIQVDYLSVNTNLTQKQSSLGVQLRSINHRRPLIDHISLQLTYSTTTTTNGRSSVDHNHGKTMDSSAKSRAIEEQMIDFVHLINETHLQFLSIFLEDNSSGGSEYNKFGDQQPDSGNGNGTGRRFGEPLAARGGGIKFNRLLAILTGLSRLELSLGQKGGNELLLESGTLKEQGRLKWLNLASNGQVMFESNIVKRSPFTYLPNLEYLSLESCNLESFPLYSLFTVPLQVGQTNVSTTGGCFNNLSTKLHYYGLPNLASLNLAGNRLTSFETDLFTRISNTNHEEMVQSMPAFNVACCNEKHDNNGSIIFHLPALTQLDLSHNRLHDITFRAGQHILCSMPNLNQLYLQHNKIIHLNLNSLLINPINMPHSFQESTNDINNSGTVNYKLQDDYNSKSQTFSQLEHIDLSHNHLSKITAIQWVGNTTSLTRVKSINLSHNRLQHPTVLLDSRLMNRLIFEESFDFIGRNGPEILSLDHLDSFLILNSMKSASTVSICDFLSPASSRSPVNNDLLNELLLTNNALSHIDSIYFSSKQCKDIQILRLSKNRIELLASDALFELRNLEQLDLSNNLISYLMEETFSTNIRLRILDLSFNRIGSIKRNLFLHLTELESLSLSDNQLLTLPDELFNQNQQLEIIDLSNNKLNHLDDSFFYHSKYLRLLNLRGNNLKKFSQQAFELITSNSNAYKGGGVATSNLPVPSSHLKSQAISNTKRQFNANLKTPNKPKRRHNRQITDGSNVLILAFNQIDSIKFESCVQFGQNIQLLWMNNNRLKELQETSFKCFRSVQRLYLSSNRIRFISDFTFHHLALLEYLDLSKNMINQVHADSFKFPNSLSHVDLSSNQLVSFNFIDSFASAKDTNTSRESLVSIENIKLGENPELKLDSVDLISFIARVGLRQIELGNIGRIESSKRGSIINASMKDRSPIQILNLSSIKYIDESLLANLSEPTVLIERIDTSYSTISSNKLIDFLRKKLRNELIELDVGGNQFGSSQVAQLFDSLDMAYRLQVLNATNNLIEYWPFNSRVASKLHKLRSIDLSQNKLRQFIKDETNNYAFPEVEVLNLSSNALVSLADNLKQRMIYLKNLMPRIKQLDLSNNRLTWIPLQFLDDLQELTWLRLNNNQLESLSPIHTSQRIILDLSFNYKLRAMVGGLEVDAYQTDVIDGENLILFDDHGDDNNNNNNRMTQMDCFTIDDYIEANKDPDRPRATTTPNELHGPTFLEWNSMNDDERVNDDRCQHLVQSIDSIILNSISGLINLNSIRMLGSKFIHLSLRHVGLIRLESSDRNNNIVLLDLSKNKIHDLPSTLCHDLIELRSLDLSNNQLNAIPYEFASQCHKLNYLNLAHNQVTSLAIKRNFSDDLKTSALLVLKLNNNMLRDLHEIDSRYLHSLRFLDLRFNQLKSDSFAPKLSHMHLLLSSPYIDYSNHNDTIKQHIEISDSYLLIDDQKVSNGKIGHPGHSINLYEFGSDNNSIAYYPESHRHFIKFCALNITHQHIKVCLQKKPDQSNEVQCFLLEVSANIPSCLTYLHEPSNGSNISNYNNSTVTNSSLPISNRRDSLDLETDADPVLSFIDSLKSYWLELRELDANDYLASIINVRNDSTYTIMDGRYTIYTLTLFKLLIVGGSVCIVALLIAMFALLTCRSTNLNQLSPKSLSGMTNVLNTDSETTESSITNTSGNSNNLTSSHTQRSSSPTPATNSSVRSRSTSDNDETQKNTVMERKTIHHQLDTNQLMLQNQACSTPSSSLAPSSVETAETLQAIDSIKSGTPIQHFGGGPTRRSVDQYAESINNSGNLHPQYQVATVMRMVKSNSANQFDPSNRSNFNHPTYGTLNNRHPNYPSLKSKLRAIHENQQQKHQIYPTTSGQTQLTDDSHYNFDRQQQQQQQHQSSYGYVQQPTYYIAQENSDLMMMDLPEMNDQISQQQDPTTVSLLSINSALASNHHHHHSSHSGINQQFQQDTYTDTLKSSGSQFPSLCQYHRLAHESGVAPERTGLIGLEGHEEEQYSNNDLAMMNNLPPPPSSRVIEALENTIHNMTTNASHEMHFPHNQMSTK